MQESVIDKTVVQEPLAGQFAGGVANTLQPGSRIILAESDDLCRKRMQGILEDQGFKVFSVADGLNSFAVFPSGVPIY